jgi:DNA-directed RNA polymerase subunit K/omega
MGAFRFVVLAALRTVQLTRGCVPRVEGDHKLTVTAQREIAQGKVWEAIPGIPESAEASSIALVEDPSSVLAQTT